MSVVGVDGCRSGWIAVVLRDAAPIEAHHLSTIAELAAKVPDAEVAGIDIPMLMPSNGRRAAEIAAREFLGPRRSSMFYTPARAVIEAPTYELASVAAAQLGGGGVSRQSYGLARKILEVQHWMPSAPCAVHEVHPELSFAVLLGQPARASKKTWAGMVERRDALALAGITIDGVDEMAGSQAAVDDMLDAAVAAWSARRIRDGAARCFPAHAEGSTDAIWA